MSMQAPVEMPAEILRRYGQGAYATVSDLAGPPRVTNVMPTFAWVALTFGLRCASCSLLEANPHHSMLWPADHAETMSLLVDADVLGVAADGTMTVRTVAAVRHHPAPQLTSRDSKEISLDD